MIVIKRQAFAEGTGRVAFRTGLRVYRRTKLVLVYVRMASDAGHGLIAEPLVDRRFVFSIGEVASRALRSGVHSIERKTGIFVVIKDRFLFPSLG